MATVTIVATYTPQTSPTVDSTTVQAAKVTSFTYGGTAYASLTAANMGQAINILDQCAKIARLGGDATTREALRAAGSQDPTS